MLLHIPIAVSPQPDFTPQWQHVIGIVLRLDLEEPRINVRVTATGYSGTSYTNGTLVLEKISGSDCGVIQTWTNISSTGPALQFSSTSEAPTPGKYRLTFTATTIRNGVSETISGSKEATYPAS